MPGLNMYSRRLCQFDTPTNTRGEKTIVKLAVWSIESQQDESGREPRIPQQIKRSKIELEKHLEDWIVNDVTLIGEGLTLVGRQVLIDDGKLDLLAIDTRDRWVVIEIKRGQLNDSTLAQALYYASSLVKLEVNELSRKVASGLSQFGDEDALSARVTELLDGEGAEREIALLLVGTGVHPGLERMIEFLGRFGIPVGIVNFEVFELEDGLKLMIREVIDEPSKPPSPRRTYTVEAISQMARDAGVSKPFERFVNMAQEADLAVQPNKMSVTIAPMANLTKFLMYARPRTGGLVIEVGPRAFAKWHSWIDVDEATNMLGKYEEGAYFSGVALDERLTQIEGFLTKNFPKPEAH